MITELTTSTFDEITSTDKPVVIEFYSPTCVHCKRMEPGLNEVADEQENDAVITRCDITTSPELAQRYDITAVPTTLFIKNGEIKDKLVGFTHKLIISQGIEKLK
ncbi:MAG: thioredoxin family protein [Ruminococcus sp.]|nr:thioredoxin family protein [Ruminococcus sp.]